MSKSPKSSSGNSNRLLLWMGLGAVLLFGSILALILVVRQSPAPPADPERTLLWIYDGANPAGPAAAAVIEESRSGESLTAFPFTPPEKIHKEVADGQWRGAQEDLAGLLQRKIHHRVYLPYSVVSTLVDAAGGITLDGKNLDGAAAVEQIRKSDALGVQVLLALGDAVGRRGVSMGVSQAMGLARQVETDLDLTAMPDLLTRWNGYSSPRVEPAGEMETLARMLKPDPAAARK